MPEIDRRTVSVFSAAAVCASILLLVAWNGHRVANNNEAAVLHASDSSVSGFFSRRDACSAGNETLVCQQIATGFGTKFNGSCIGGFCQCCPGFSGNDCNVTVDECGGDPCNGGTCNNFTTCDDSIGMPYRFFCSNCPPGRYGDRCELSCIANCYTCTDVSFR